jgi:ABC-2 type transport system permease protein
MQKMRSLYSMYRKEMGHYFVSPVAYVLVGVFLLLSAFFFDRILTIIIQSSMQQEMQAMRFGGAQAIDVPGLVMRNFFGLLSSLILFLTPMLTMGVYAEERKRGTMELLMTSPITDLEIVLGKFLASLSLFAIMLLPTASYIVFMYFRSDPMPSWKLLLAGYLGVLLLGGALLSLGSFLSSLTENQLIAAVLTFGATLILWVGFSGSESGTLLGQVMQYLSVTRHYDDFTRGIIDTSALIYYVSFIALCIFLTVRSLESMRWRRA